jgi:hypothetical protein
LVHWFCSRISSPALTTVHIFYLTSRCTSLVVGHQDLSLDLFRAFTFVVCPVEAFVVVTSIGLGYLGIQGRRLLVIGKPFRQRCLPTRRLIHRPSEKSGRVSLTVLWSEASSQLLHNLRMTRVILAGQRLLPFFSLPTRQRNQHGGAVAV